LQKYRIIQASQRGSRVNSVDHASVETDLLISTSDSPSKGNTDSERTSSDVSRFALFLVLLALDIALKTNHYSLSRFHVPFLS